MLLQRASDIALQEEIFLIVSMLAKIPYMVLVENITIAFNPQGELVSEYFKHGRSLGELCQKGDGILKSFDTEYGRIAPFICSDMAFLSKIQQAGRNNVDILIVPASDWKEMTLLAAKTAIVRGVENGSFTLYSYIGNLFVYLCNLLKLFSICFWKSKIYPFLPCNLMINSLKISERKT